MNIYSSNQFGNNYISHPFGDWEAKSSIDWLNESSKVFCIGSCFARNISLFLKDRGIYSQFDDSYGFHYNPVTIHEELNRASGGRISNLFWKVDRGGRDVFFDSLRNKIYAKSNAEIIKKSESINQKFKSYFQMSNSFVVTLGLSEVWEQRYMGGWKVINRAPIRDIYDSSQYRNRFLTVQQISDCLKKIIKIIQVAKGKNIPIVFTVSPIPLKTSSSRYDPRIANTRSKANLIVSVHQVLEELDNPYVTYFHSYDYFIAPNRPVMFKEDARHPLEQYVKNVCDMFVKTYSSEKE